jgi:hypothetical protein
MLVGQRNRTCHEGNGILDLLACSAALDPNRVPLAASLLRHEGPVAGYGETLGWRDGWVPEVGLRSVGSLRLNA